MLLELFVARACRRLREAFLETFRAPVHGISKCDLFASGAPVHSISTCDLFASGVLDLGRCQLGLGILPPPHILSGPLARTAQATTSTALETVRPDIARKTTADKNGAIAVNVVARKAVAGSRNMKRHGVVVRQCPVDGEPDVRVHNEIGSAVDLDTHQAGEDNRVEDIVVVAVDLDGCRIGRAAFALEVIVKVRLAQPALASKRRKNCVGEAGTSDH